MKKTAGGGRQSRVMGFQKVLCSEDTALQGRPGMYLRQGKAGSGGERKVCRMQHYCGRAYLVGAS